MYETYSTIALDTTHVSFKCSTLIEDAQSYFKCLMSWYGIFKAVSHKVFKYIEQI